MQYSNHTKILGIIGYPISHSLSPLMHNTAISHYKMNYIYLPFAVVPDELPLALQGIKSLQFTGINVTIPFKEKIIKYLDEISVEAKLIGAVNTILIKNGKTIGYNTDGIGFITSIKEYVGVTPLKKNILILGAGGAARAVAVQLAMSKAAGMVIANRTHKRAESLARHIKNNIPGRLVIDVISYDKTSIKKRIADVDIIINTTSQGMSGKNDIKKFPYECITDKHLICDLVYNPLETYFLRESKKRGANILNGLGMLIYQGSHAFKIWTKKRLPVHVVEPILRKKLNI